MQAILMQSSTKYQRIAHISFRNYSTCDGMQSSISSTTELCSVAVAVDNNRFFRNRLETKRISSGISRGRRDTTRTLLNRRKGSGGGGCKAALLFFYAAKARAHFEIAKWITPRLKETRA